MGQLKLNHETGFLAGALVLAAATFLSGAGRASPAPSNQTLSAGTVVTVQMIDPVDSGRNHVGEEFAATVAAPVVVGDTVMIPKGADARVRLVESKNAGRIKGQSELELELVKLMVHGDTYNVESGIYTTMGSSRSKRSAKMIGGGAGLGALIGAVAGKGKGAAIGAVTGAAAGTAIEASTHGQRVKVPPEAKIDFVLRNSLSLNS